MDGAALARIEADTLFTGAWIVTMDAAQRVIADGAMAIAGERIVAVGTTAELRAVVDARETIDARRFVITPGFVNGHVHTTETLVKGFIPENLPFDEAIWRWSVPLYESHTPEDQRLAAQLSAVSMLRTGTTCFLEAGTIIDLDPVFEGLSETGIRGRLGQWAMDRAFSPEDDQTKLTDTALRVLDDELARYPGGNGQLLAAWPLLIGHNTATDALWLHAKQIADTHKAGISAHMSPMEGDAAWYLANTGKRPIVHLAELGVLGPNVSLTHMVHVDGAELSLLAQTGANVIQCPGAALKGGFGLADFGLFPEMAAAGITIMLGTDGGDGADLMRSITLVASLFKDARRDGALFPADQALRMATMDGARALQMGESIGSLDIGKKADFVLHDTHRPDWRPLLNCVRHLVWSADGRGVHSVWVNGRRVVDTYRCTLVDEDRLYAVAQEAAEGIVARSGLPLV
jgi:cytosine/adenosine deaminase-related metal-dependent hydrolase